MQRKLATWSTENPERKFDRLLRLIADRAWLAEAARITLASSGARTPGVDGVDKTMMTETLHQELATIRAELLAGSYTPLPARRVYIPKANGTLRPLGIPSLRDRVVQRAMLMAMEPIWESDFHRASYGFRPARSVHHAIRTVKLQLQESDEQRAAGRWVIEGDLASYFETVHHRLLLKAVRKRIADQRFLALLWTCIKAGCVDRGLFCAASEGVPQGCTAPDFLDTSIAILDPTCGSPRSTIVVPEPMLCALFSRPPSDLPDGLSPPCAHAAADGLRKSRRT